MLRDAHYRDKLRHRARGLRDLEATVGGVCGEIDARLPQRDVVRVLELGCGYGTALLELRARYGSRVELHGMNRRHDDGNVDVLLRNARERQVFGARAPEASDLPALAYGDVADGLPFPDESCDLVYSQVAWRYVGHKIGGLRDVRRVRQATPHWMPRLQPPRRRPPRSLPSRRRPPHPPTTGSPRCSHSWKT